MHFRNVISLSLQTVRVRESDSSYFPTQVKLHKKSLLFSDITVQYMYYMYYIVINNV